jgi:hypothetical protein
VYLNVTFRVVSEGASALHLVPYRQGFYEGEMKEDGVFLLSYPDFVNTYPDIKDAYYGTPVSISAHPEVINVGESTTLSGAVSGNARASVTSVNLEYTKEGGDWTFLAAVPTNGSGFFTYQFTANEIADYQFRVYFTLAGKNAQSLVAVVTVQNISSHFYYVYYILAALILSIAAIIIVYYIRKRRRPEEFPLPS